jgi:hypothetical protein
MTSRSNILSACLIAALGTMMLPARAEWKYPDWSGQWTDLSANRWDPSRPPDNQQAPLTPEYQARLDAAQADRRLGGRGNTQTISCGHTGMPRAMILYETMEITIKPNVTYVMFSFIDPLRRIFTDGRDWPAAPDPAWLGYSIGHWEGDRDGKYDTLVIETRNVRGPRILDGLGTPFHDDNQTIIKERISLDKTTPDTMRNEITLIDHALTRPWTVTRGYKRNHDPKVVWSEYDCNENNEHVFVGSEAYLISADGFLMPTRRDQPPPDARYFKAPPK